MYCERLVSKQLNISAQIQYQRDGEMTKKPTKSASSQIMTGGLLILIGTTLLCVGGVNILMWPWLYPSPMIYDVVKSDTYENGVLNASSPSVQLSLDGQFNRVELTQLWTNDTPIAFILHWNNTLLFTLNLSVYQYGSYILYENDRFLYGNDYNTTLTISRVTTDVTFFVRIRTRSHFEALVTYIYPIFFIVGLLILGSLVLGGGFYRLRRTIRSLENHQDFA